MNFENGESQFVLFRVNVKRCNFLTERGIYRQGILTKNAFTKEAAVLPIELYRENLLFLIHQTNSIDQTI